MPTSSNQGVRPQSTARFDNLPLPPSIRSDPAKRKSAKAVRTTATAPAVAPIPRAVVEIKSSSVQHRHNKGRLPQITFTSDFHELVQGDLIPGPCVLRYDPLRLLSPELTPDGDHTVHAYIRFHPNGGLWAGAMTIPPSTIALGHATDPSGQGVMLETSFTLPSGCKELEVWFSHTHPDGTTSWDSDHGRNHWLRFGLHDIELKHATVRSAGKTVAHDSFELELHSASEVEGVSVHWRLTNVPGFPRQKIDLVGTAAAPGGKRWTTPESGIPVPNGSTVAFDLVYVVAGRTYADDNQGRWYVAD